MSSAVPWSLDRFLEEFDLWAEREHPEQDLRVVVTDWILTRTDDPYRGMRRQAGFDNLWFGSIPESGDGSGHVVACSYFVFEAEHRVRCNSFATLALPL